jgi:uncharacterized protein YcbK (DUF882 family)
MLALGVFATAKSRAAGEVRTLTFFNIHNNEITAIEFKRDGQFVAGALEKFNWAFRDWRRNEPTKMDPALIDLLWEIHTELGSKQPIHIISGFRSRGTNEMLRSSVGGQASESRHILGKAADVHFPDVPLKALRYSALVRQRGGVGYYPTSGIPFVHVDTDRVRHWPRLPHYELALLFPSGQTKHQSSDGRTITSADVRTAKVEHRDLASQIAAFYDSRAGRRPPVALAGLDGSSLPQGNVQTAGLTTRAPAGVQMASLQPPQLVEAPRVIDRPSRFALPSSIEQARMNDLVQRTSFAPQRTETKVAAAPQLLTAPALATRPRTPAADPAVAAYIPELPPLATGFAGLMPASTAPPAVGPSFVTAPDFDEDHPDEMSYRPFPIAPLMTTTASVDDPALITLIHPDFARTFDLLDQAGSMLPMHLRPSLKVAETMWTQQFTGDAVNFAALQPAAREPVTAALASRKVRTQ